MTNELEDAVNELPDLIKVSEAAKLLRVTTSTVNNYIRGGKLKVVSIGPFRYRIQKSDLKEFLNLND